MNFARSMGETVADFSAQAVVNAILTKAFPDDPIVGMSRDSYRSE